MKTRIILIRKTETQTQTFTVLQILVGSGAEGWITVKRPPFPNVDVPEGQRCIAWGFNPRGLWRRFCAPSGRWNAHVAVLTWEDLRRPEWGAWGGFLSLGLKPLAFPKSI